MAEDDKHPTEDLGEFIREMTAKEESQCTCEQPTFEQELVQLLNKHNMERYSGTPDWILANYLVGVLRQFDCAVQIRANWRGESTELPALQRLFEESVDGLKKECERTIDKVAPGAFDGNDGKTVPIVQYVDGRRNEIGEAKIKIAPGEVLFTGTLANIESVVPLLGLSIPEGQFSIADTDPLGKGDR